MAMLEQHLMKQRGHFKCGTEGHEEGFWISFTDVQKQLNEKYKFDEENVGFTLSELILNMIDLLNEGHFENILMTD